MPTYLIVLSTSFVLVGSFCVLYSYFKPRAKASHPPGPAGYPVIGNLLSFPLRYPWKHFQSKVPEHGDLIYYHGLGNSILVLNSMEAITDLLIRKGNIYSSRPYVTVACELMDLIHSTAVLPFGSRWKLHRRLSRIGFSTDKIKQYDGVISDFMSELMDKLHQDPDGFARHIRLASGKVLLNAVYGINDCSTEEQYISTAKAAQSMAAKSLIPLAFLVDLVPQLKYLPKWTPFLTSHKAGVEGRTVIAECIGKPFERVKEEIKAGIAKPSFTLDVLTEDEFAPLREKEENFEFELKWLSGTMFVGGQELTSANIVKMISAIALNPDKLKKGQEELKRVIGSRPPMVKDREHCPYVDAIVKETMRYQCCTPVALFRSSIKDDFYRGYFIPKNTLIVPNVWAIANAPDDEYPPEVFAPERFLREIPPIDPSNYIFGFGRRICPGRAMAENVMFLMTANILKSFDIGHKLDENGQEIPINVEYTTGLLALPSAFRCSIKPTAEA